MQLSKDVKVGYVEVEVDAPDVGMGRADLPMRYSVSRPCNISLAFRTRRPD